MGDVKVRLKKAKEHIDGQEWQKAADILNRVLQDDAKNVGALVLSGKCAMELQQRDKALDLFRSAVKVQPELLAAWQGIIAFHARFPPAATLSAAEKRAVNEELLEGYRRGLESFGDDSNLKLKILEFLKGYSAQLIIKGEFDEAVVQLQRLADLATGYGNKELRVDARKGIIRAMIPIKYSVDPSTLPPEKLEHLLETFKELLSESDVGTMEEFYPQEHLNILLRHQRYGEASATAQLYLDRYGELFLSTLSFAYATLFMLALRRILESNSAEEADLAQLRTFQEKLASFESQHPLVRISKSYQFYLQRNYSKAADLWEKAIMSVKGISSLPDAYKVPLLSVIEVWSRKYLGISWVCLDETVKCQQGVGFLEEIRRSGDENMVDWQVFFYLACGYVQLGRLKDASAVITEGNEKFAGVEGNNSRMLIGAAQASIALAEKNHPEAERLAEDALLIREDNHLFHYFLFRALWDTGRRDPRRCLKHLKRSHKLCPGFGILQMYLGLWTWIQDRDIEAALIQLEQAFVSLPTNSQIVRALTDICTADHRDKKAIDILQTALERHCWKYEDSRWMRLRLALLAYRNSMWQECIVSIRQVLRDCPDDPLLQEFLGDALAFRGNYWSAKGVFETVLEQAAQHGQVAEYSWYRRATIRQLLKLDEEAQSDFVELQKRSPWFRQTCLHSLAQLEIRKAQASFASHFVTRGVQACQKSLNLLAEGALSDVPSTLIWTLLGDTCLLMRHVHASASPELSTLSIDKFFWDGSPPGEQIQLNVRQTLYLSTLFYATAIEGKRTSGRLWERLAVSYWYLAQRVAKGGDTDAAKKWMGRALLAAKEMLLRNAHNPWLWTTAGVIVGTSPLPEDREQRALDASRLFTKSLELFRRFDINPTSTGQTWTALGYLFLNINRNMAAHQVLIRAQSANPNLAEAWQGQARCAERTGFYLEATDLYRHACSLTPLKDSMRRYAEWVLWVLHDKSVPKEMRRDVIVRLEAVNTAVNYLGQYIQVSPEDVELCMLMSALNEWAGLTRTALHFAEKSLAMLENRPDRFEPAVGKQWNDARFNVARLLCSLGRYKESLDMIQSIEAAPSVQSLLLLAIVDFRLGNYDDCVGILEILAEMDEEESAGDGKPALSTLVKVFSAVICLYTGSVDQDAWDSLSKLIQQFATEKFPSETPIMYYQCLCVMALRGSPELTNAANRFHESHLSLEYLLAQVGCSTDETSSEQQEKRERNILRFVHLRPDRLDFRFSLAKYLASLPGNTTKQLLPEAERALDFAIMSDREFSASRLRSPELCQPSKNLWHFLLQYPRWHLQALHLFPAEKNWRLWEVHAAIVQLQRLADLATGYGDKEIRVDAWKGTFRALIPSSIPLIRPLCHLESLNNFWKLQAICCPYVGTIEELYPQVLEAQQACSLALDLAGRSPLRNLPPSKTFSLQMIHLRISFSLYPALPVEASSASVTDIQVEEVVKAKEFIRTEDFNPFGEDDDSDVPESPVAPPKPRRRTESEEKEYIAVLSK